MTAKLTGFFVALLCAAPIGYAEISGSGWRINGCRSGIGDRVWHDRDGNGIQDPGEPGLGGVRVHIAQQGGASAYVDSVLTDPDGSFGFIGLCAGTYEIDVDEQTLPAGGSNWVPTATNAGDESSDSSGTAPLAVVIPDPTTFELSVDFGYHSCGLGIEQTCTVVPAPADLGCEKDITATRLRYTGPTMFGAEVELQGKDHGEAYYASIDLISGETVLDGQNGYSIDAGSSKLGSHTKIYLNGQEEQHHTSCSEPYVAGLPAPLESPKGDPSANWQVEAFIDDTGRRVELPAPLPPADTCEIVHDGDVLCTKKPVDISFLYNGGGCAQSDNTMDPGKWYCNEHGAADGPVSITIYKDSMIYADLSGVEAGEVVVARSGMAGRTDVDSDLYFNIYDASGQLVQDMKIHVSCSQDIRPGDRFGPLDIFGYVNPEQGAVQAGAEVVYGYEISNSGPGPVTDLVLTDDATGEVDGSPVASLAAGETIQLLSARAVTETTTSIASVAGLAGGSLCEAADAVTVTVRTRPCTVYGEASFDHFHSDHIHWKLTNDGGPIAATLASLEIDWPTANGDLIEVQLDGDTIFDAPRSAPSTVIEPGDWINLPGERQLEPDATRTLKLKFADDIAGTPSDYSITVNFDEGCLVSTPE